MDGFLREYNTNRPHQSLGMAFPADRFTPNTDTLLPLKIPTVLTEPRQKSSPATDPDPTATQTAVVPAIPATWEGGPVEFERVVPPSGNLQVAGKQFWLGTARSGLTVTFWADTDVIHLLIAGTRIKSLRSHLSVTDLATLARTGRPAGPPPLPAAPAGQSVAVVEVDRIVNATGSVSLGQHLLVAADILAGRRVTIRVEERTLTFLDPDTRELLRTRPNPLTPAEIARLQTARPAGPAPLPRTEPVTVQRRASSTGMIMVAWQRVALGRVHAGKTVTIQVSDTELTIHCDDGPRTIRRTNTKPITRIKVHRPRKVDQNV